MSNVYLECRRRNELLFINEEDKEFLLEFINEFGIEGFLEEHMGSNICSRVSGLINSYIDNNRIFECRTGDKIKPMIIHDNTAKPKGYQPLSLEKLSFLSKFATFLSESYYGISVNN